jgi:hypothetical protein
VRHSTGVAPSRVRLACVRRAANVRSEPGSNSPVRSGEGATPRLRGIVLWLVRPHAEARGLCESVFDEPLSEESKLVKMHRDPQQFERTIQFSRTERKLVSVEGAETLDCLTRSVNRKSALFSIRFGLIRNADVAQIFSPGCPNGARAFMLRTRARIGQSRTGK